MATPEMSYGNGIAGLNANSSHNLSSLNDVFKTGGNYNVSGQSNQNGASHSAQPQSGGICDRCGSMLVNGECPNDRATVYTATITNRGSGYSSPLTTTFFNPFDKYAIIKPEPLKSDGIKIGELVGWRGWKIDDHGFLRSMSADVLWAPGEPMRGDIKSGIEHNGCYAYKLARDFLKKHQNGLDVWGKVHMWGRCIEHELGWRSEWMKIVSLEGAINPCVETLLPELRKRYKLEN